MRSSVAAFALFRRAAAAGRAEYLAQWNDGWGAFHFVGGHKRDDESFHDCCVREAAQELGLVEGRDFRVAAERRNRLRYVHFSERAKAETDYTVELFDAELLGEAAAAVGANPGNRWLTEGDVRTGRCRDGRAVSPTMLRVLSLAGLTPDEFDVFVSYAHRDDADGWVAALLDALRAEHRQFTNVPLWIFFLWKNPEVTYADYLARLEAEGTGAVEGAADVTPVEQVSRHPEKFIGRLLEPTLALLSPPELRALEYAARLPADMVALPWLEALLRKDMPETMTKRPGYPDPWQQVVRRLDGLRLLVYDRAEPRLPRVHRVVRDVVTARMGADVAAERSELAVVHAWRRALELHWHTFEGEAAWEMWEWEIDAVKYFAMELIRDNDRAGFDIKNVLVSGTAPFSFKLRRWVMP